MMKKSIHGLTLAAAAFAAVLATSGSKALANTVVFQDNFGNGTVANSDSVTNFWASSTTNESTVTEAGGKLILAAGGTSSTSNQQIATVITASTSDTFNFFTQKLNFSGVVGVSSNTASSWQAGSRFVIESEARSDYSANDVLCLSMRPGATSDAFALAYKKNNSAMSPDVNDPSVTFLIGSSSSFITLANHHIVGFDLTLDATTYTLVIHLDGGVDSTTYTGLHGINVTDWGNGSSNGGKSALQMENVRVSGDSTVAGKNSTSSWDSLTVTQVDPVPEPAAFGVLAGGGIILAMAKRFYKQR